MTRLEGKVMKTKRTLLCLLLAIGLMSSLAASSALTQNSQELREELNRTFPLSSGGRVTLENIAGKVKIAAWDRNEVKVEAVKRAYTRERLSEVQININSNGDSLDIQTEYPEHNYRFNKGEDRRNSLASVDYTLTVPRNARLEGIELVSSDLELDGLAGDVKASVVSGSVTARGLTGEARLSTVSGRLDVTFNQLNETKAISLGSVSGPVTLTIPSNSNAQLRANTVHGSITNDFGLPVRRGDYVGRDLAGTLGSGGPRIKLGNVSGPITIRHAADGRPLSPVTNQLPQTKGDDDEDSDSDDEARDAQREAQRAVREAAREARQAQIEAQRAARDAQREAQRAARESQTEAQREAMEAQREAEKEARETQLEAERAVREAQRASADEVREAQREAQRALRDNQREIERATREAARAGREAARATRDVYINDNNDLRLVERESKSFAVSGLSRVTLNTFDGRISIRAWDKPEVMVTAIKRASNEQTLRGIIFKAEQNGSEIGVQTNYDKSAARRVGNDVYSVNASVTLEVFVPRNTNIKANSGDGRIELEGVTGGVTLQTEDGRIEVRDGGGQLIAKTDDGRIDVLNYTGDVNAETDDGRISLDGRFSQLAAKTGDGSILLALPSDLDATIETDADSVSGDGVNVEAEPGTGKKLRRFKIGRGGTLFRLQTGDGSVYLRRK